MLLPVPFTVAASTRPSRLKSRGQDPVRLGRPDGERRPLGANDACAGAVDEHGAERHHPWQKPPHARSIAAAPPKRNR